MCARKMGMSEEEFWNSCPIFFIECLQIFAKERREEAKLWQMI